MNRLYSITEFSDDVSTGLGRGCLDFVHLTVGHTHHTMGKCFETNVVSHHNHGDLFLHVEVDEDFHDNVSAAGIEITCWLIEEQDLWLVGN